MEKIITQIGSLPYENPMAAMIYSWRHDIPFLPELTYRNELMLEYIKNPGELSCLKYFKDKKYEIVKVQCVGPATLMHWGYSEKDALTRAHEHISKILDGLESERTIVFLDDPAMEEVDVSYRALWEILFHDLDVEKGVHTCDRPNWDKLYDSDIDIISFDASRYDFDGKRNGKRIAWGVCEYEDVKDFQEGDLITLPCGMAHYNHSVYDCERNLEKLLWVKKKLNENR
jgi:hypothetical protein